MSEIFRDHVLIFDADDTLWENNVFFERVVDNFLDWVDHPTLSRREIRAIIDEVEATNIPVRGYGTRAFLANLADTLEHVRQSPITDTDREDIDVLAVALLEHRIELLDGVADTLADLGRRHPLFLLTKGHPTEQQRKIDASGLAGLFRSTHVVAEKNPQTYRDLVHNLELVSAASWMIGNSPKSDILSARAADLNAVHIPHTSTWVLEHAELDPTDQRILVLGSFRELTQHF